MEVIESALDARGRGWGGHVLHAVRLLEMWRVLNLSCSIGLHCYLAASHYLEAVLDAILASQNFKNETAWCNKSSGTVVGPGGEKVSGTAGAMVWPRSAHLAEKAAQWPRQGPLVFSGSGLERALQTRPSSSASEAAGGRVPQCAYSAIGMRGLVPSAMSGRLR